MLQKSGVGSASNQRRLAIILRPRAFVSDAELSILSYDESTSELTVHVPSRNLLEIASDVSLEPNCFVRGRRGGRATY
jgi:hypothetical protein